MLSIFDKFNNKCFFSKDEKKQWNKNFSKGKYKIPARKMKEKGTMCHEEDVDDNDMISIFVLRDGCEILLVESLLVKSFI